MLGEQFNSVLGFPRVTEYLDKEVEEIFVNRSMRASGPVPTSLQSFKAEQMKQTPSKGQKGPARGGTIIIGGSAVECSQRGDRLLKSVSSRQKADKENFSPDSMHIARASIANFTPGRGAC